MQDLSHIRTERRQITASTPFADLPEQLTVDEFIAVSRLSRWFVYDHARRGLLPSIRYGRVVRIPKTALQGISGVQDVR